MRNFFAVIILSVLLFSCAGKKAVPPNILAPKKMELVFWDYIRADVFTKEFISKDITRSDTLENLKLQQRIFSYYHISKEDFYRSYQYYNGHPELMNALMDSIIAKQNRYKIKNQNKTNRRTFQPGDKQVSEAL